MQGTYAVIGDPIDHSLSPAIHNAAFRSLGMDCSYIAYRIVRGELEDGVAALKASKVAGFNVTIPHKVAMMDLLDEADPECAEAGACNTVSVRGGRLVGHNTDVGGFLDPLERHGVGLDGAAALVLGTGGAARAVVLGLAKKRARITVAGRSRERAEELAAAAGAAGAEARAADFADAPQSAPDSALVVNATSVGMGDGATPLRPESIAAGSVVYDIVYRPVKTPLISAALERGASVIYGYEMLLGQAALSFSIWHGVPAPYDAMRRAVLGVGAQ